MPEGDRGTGISTRCLKSRQRCITDVDSTLRAHSVRCQNKHVVHINKGRTNSDITILCQGFVRQEMGSAVIKLVHTNLLLGGDQEH